ncbi:MAG: polyhydroxyalkanoic acid system family protein [Pirellulaceae bacterium]|nr:polyhydroxyalkanoic acid system family protein [Pirellulaceae bacterium]
MMEIEASVEHQLGDDAALNRLHQMVDSLQDRYRDQVHCVESRWNGNELDISFAAYGFHINWHATVFSDRIALIGRIPPAARAYRGKIEQAIVARVEQVFQE